MKIEQAKQFTPVVITLETPAEVKIVWDALADYEPLGPENTQICRSLVEWFSQANK